MMKCTSLITIVIVFQVIVIAASSIVQAASLPRVYRHRLRTNIVAMSQKTVKRKRYTPNRPNERAGDHQVRSPRPWYQERRYRDNNTMKRGSLHQHGRNKVNMPPESQAFRTGARKYRFRHRPISKPKKGRKNHRHPHRLHRHHRRYHRQRPSYRPKYGSNRPSETQFVSTDFSAASVFVDPIVLFNVFPRVVGTVVDVELVLPSIERRDAEIIAVQGSNVQPGSECSVAQASWTLRVTPGEGSLTVSLEDNGVDTIIALCIDNVIVAQSYYLFKTQGSIRYASGGEFPNLFLVHVDFSQASLETPVRESYVFGPGTSRSSSGGMVVLYGVAPRYRNFQSNSPGDVSIEAFYLTSPGRDLNMGDSCPSIRSLPSDGVYPLSVFILRGTNDRTVYACSSADRVVVGIVDFEYVTRSPYGQPLSPDVPVVDSSLTDAPTRSPAQSPIRPPSLAPRMSPVAKITPRPPNLAPSVENPSSAPMAPPTASPSVVRSDLPSSVPTKSPVQSLHSDIPATMTLSRSPSQSQVSSIPSSVPTIQVTSR